MAKLSGEALIAAEFSKRTVSAQGDYILVSLSADWTATLALPHRVRFNSVLSGRGDLSLDDVTNVGRISGLKAGRTYQLDAVVMGSGSGGYWKAQWYDVTKGALIGVMAFGISVNSGATVAESPAVAHVFTPDEDTVVEVRVIAADDVTDDILAQITPGRESSRSAPSRPTSLVAWSFSTRLSPRSDVTTVSFGAGGDGLFQRALDGDVDGEYIIAGNVISAASFDGLLLRPNGISTNQGVTTLGDVLASGADTLQSTNTATSLLLAWDNGGVMGVGSLYSFECCLQAATGMTRGFRGQYSSVSASNNYKGIFTVGGGWKDLSTVITSLDVVANVASSIGAGSSIRLYRRTTNNLRADSADTYMERVEGSVPEGNATLDEITAGPALYGGSVVAVGVEVADAVTAGTITVNLKLGGVTKATVVLNTTNPLANTAIVSLGAQRFSRGDLITFEIVTAGGYTNALGAPTGITCKAQMQNAALFQGPSGGKQHIKTIRVESAAQTTVTFDGLDGDVDGIYCLEYTSVGVGAAADIEVRPNGAATNISSSKQYAGTTSGVVIGGGNLPIGVGTYQCTGIATLHARTGRARGFVAQFSQIIAAGNRFVADVGGLWNETATNITSIVVASSGANIGIGSEFRLYRLTETAGAVEVL